MALNQVGLERLNTATTKKIGTNKNLIINGAMEVAQRGTSSTSSSYQTVDRFETQFSGTDENPTQAQVDVASGTTPYTLGFRKALKITNGDQTSGAGAADQIYFRYKPEAQDIASSGWNYTSTSSFVTLSFWVKSSVAQGFQFTFRTDDGTSYIYIMETGSLTADTWTKVTKTIPGNANLSINNDNGEGPQLVFVLFSGTDFTSNSATADAWQAYSSGILFGRDSTSTWYTTNNATLEITGVQLEVGSVATDFEHRSFAEELKLCKRYFQIVKGDFDDYTGFSAYSESATSLRIPVQLDTPMRAAFTNSKSGVFRFQGATNDSADAANAFNLHGVNTSFNACTLRSTAYSGMGAADRPGNLQFRQDSSSLKFDAEL